VGERVELSRVSGREFSYFKLLYWNNFIPKRKKRKNEKRERDEIQLN